jgi:amino acid transporter
MATVEAGAAGEKGLKGGTLGFLSGVVIGVASTAPGYSLASALGLVVAVGGMGLAAPSVMLVAFIPMLFTAAAYYYLNRADPDCGTTFSWASKAMGPWVGWIGGWGVIVADVIVMANLSQIAGLYTFSLFGFDNPSTTAVTTVGVIWIVVMTWICYIGIEVSANVQYGLLGAEILILVLFSVVALYKVYSGHPSGSLHFSMSWLNPFEMGGWSTLAEGLILAIFIYWGWDSTVTVNEESADSTEGPGRAAVWSTVILVLIYVVVTISAQAFHGPQFLADNSDDVLGALGKDVLGTPWDKLLIIAVLTSASASTQTTILPTTRTMLSMAAKRALPAYFARVHPRYLTPSSSTIWMGAISIVWYVVLTAVSESILSDSIAGLGLAIAFYYGLTALACPWYYRKQVTASAKNVLFLLVAPLAGGLVLIWALVYSLTTLGKGPVTIFVGMMAVGVVLMFLQFATDREFFRRPMETAPDDVLTGTGPSPVGGN